MTFTKTEVRGFADHVKWMTDTPVGYFLIYLDRHLVGCKPA